MTLLRPSLSPAATLLVVAIVTLASFAPPSWSARRGGDRAARDLDRQVVAISQLRDRGEVDEALHKVRALLANSPQHVGAHRLYQEMAAMSRRSGFLVEAEYRHFWQEKSEDPLRRLLHAASALAGIAVSPQLASRDLIREVEASLAAAEGHPHHGAQAHLVSADLRRWIGDVKGVEEHLESARKSAPEDPEIRAASASFLASEKRWTEASKMCFGLLRDAPWRLLACAPLLPRKAGAEAASPDDQEKLVALLEKLERTRKKDDVTLTSLHRLYTLLGEKRGARRLDTQLAELVEDWRPALERNPYLRGLPGGELTSSETETIERIQKIRAATGGDPWGRVRAYQDLESTLPDAARIQSYFYRELAFALRNPEVLDRDGSRAAARKALERTPDDPSVMNEWAYMSAMDKVDLSQALETVDRALEMLLGRPFDPMSISPGESFEDWEVDFAESVGAFVDTRGWVLYQLGRHAEAVHDLELASLLTRDGTVQGHLGRARYALGNDPGGFHHLLRALALGTEDYDEVRGLALHLYDKLHVVPGGLDSLVASVQTQLLGKGGAAAPTEEMEAPVEDF